MKILVSGSSGFIGYHLVNYLLTKRNKVIGIDNNNNYYSSKIKKKRLRYLKKNSNFIFKKLNLINEKNLEKVFINFKPEIVFHLAGQPGVLYSLKNPKIYEINNVKATKSICKICRKYNIKKFIFGSSSSVYGDQKKFPIKETFQVNPKNPYANTKLKSENIVVDNFKNTKTKFLIFRFFTVYGPFGRPDMFIHKFLNSIKKNKQIKLYNNGLNFRDFTYVDDVIKILSQSIKKKINNQIFNICRSKPILTTTLVEMILNYYKKKNLNIKKTKFVKGEMHKTHGCNKKLKKYFRKTSFIDIRTGIRKTIQKFKTYGY